MRKTTVIIGLILVLSLLSACAKQDKKSSERPPIPVDIHIVGMGAGDASTTYVGKLVAASEIPLVSPRGGRVEYANMHTGQRVSKGERLLQVDTTAAHNALISARAMLRQAKDAYQRLEKVYKEGGVSEVKWVEMETQLAKAQGVHESAMRELNECVLKSPADGILDYCQIENGQNLVLHQKITNLLIINDMDVVFSVPENELGRFGIGDHGKVIVSALDNATFDGQISERGMTAHRLSHSYELRMRIANNGDMRPGMVCKVEMPHRQTMGCIIPSGCIQTRQNGPCVWIIKDGKAQRRDIKAVSYLKNGIMVEEGLALGDTVIVSGFHKLYTNAEIVINSVKE